MGKKPESLSSALLSLPAPCGPARARRDRVESFQATLPLRAVRGE